MTDPKLPLESALAFLDDAEEILQKAKIHVKNALEALK